MHEPILFGQPLHLLFLYFIIYSFLGWCMETVYCSLKERRPVPRGFLLGPICPIYGVGVLMMICWFAPFMGSPLLFYLVATVCMSAWEYFVGWLLEVTTHIKYWDYSMYKFNLKGRICLWVCLTWGALAYIILYWIHPAVSQLVLKLPLTARYILAIVLAVVLIADAATTIRKLALIAKLMRKLEQARVQLSLGRAELEDALQEARDELSEKLAVGSLERKTRRQENAARLQKSYDELLAKAERTSRRFLRRYTRMSSKRYSSNLSDLKRFAGQLKQRLEQAKQERNAGKMQ
jgi:uncharacterized membrane protein